MRTHGSSLLSIQASFSSQIRLGSKNVDALRLRLVSFEVVGLPLGLRSMINDCIVVRWSRGPLRVILLVFHPAFGHLLVDGCMCSS